MDAASALTSTSAAGSGQISEQDVFNQGVLMFAFSMTQQIGHELEAELRKQEEKTDEIRQQSR